MLQLLLCMLILLVLGAYFLTAVYAFADAVRLALRGSRTGSGPMISWPQWAVLTGSVAGLVAPNLRTRLAESGELYQRIMRYTWTGATRNRLTGDVQALLDRVNERPEIRSIHLVGFSFGALVTLDTLLPTSSRPAPIQQVRSMVTLGCPFEVIEMLSPAYGRGRTPATPQPITWVNVFQPIDVLASTFGGGRGRTRPAGIALADGSHRRPDLNIAWNAEFTLTPVNFLMLPSLYSHGQYWDQDTGCRGALGVVVDALYAGTPVLG
jgi:pimeloyl-ACP methyl ester carboxylesterase